MGNIDKITIFSFGGIQIWLVDQQGKLIAKHQNIFFKYYHGKRLES